MKMRLIMASYFWLEPDVILVDEALEVGDARFRDIIREKKMKTYLSKGGSIILCRIKNSSYADTAISC